MVADKNAWDALRLLAALMVLLSHQYALLGQAEPVVAGWNTLGGLGVSVFFFLSGVLIWQSWQRDPAPGRFLQRRGLRIFPALWVVALLSVFVLGAWCTAMPLGAYLSDPRTWAYLSGGALVIRHQLPGVFEGNPYPLAVNGSLWTLPVEFSCYLTVLAVGLGARRVGPWLVWVGLLAAVAMANWGPWLVGARWTAHFEMVAVFWWGVVCAESVWGSRPQRQRWVAWLVVVLILDALAGEHGLARNGITLLAVMLVLVFLYWRAGARLTRWMGDWSYGVYVYAFPVQQFWVQVGLGRGWSWAHHLALSALTTLALAGLSWHWVEKPALRLKPVVT